MLKRLSFVKRTFFSEIKSKLRVGKISLLLINGFFFDGVLSFCRNTVLLHSFLKKGYQIGSGRFLYLNFFKLQKICQLFFRKGN